MNEAVHFVIAEAITDEICIYICCTDWASFVFVYP